MKKLYFIRHGESQLNADGVFAGHTETPLTQAGRNQASAAGKEAKKLEIDLIVASPLSRTLETARILAKEIDYNDTAIAVHQNLIERNCGDLEGKPWRRGFDFSRIPNAESDKQLIKRAKEVVVWLESLEANHILVVSHGGFGRALRKVLIADSDFYEQIPNAQLVCWVGKN